MLAGPAESGDENGRAGKSGATSLYRHDTANSGSEGIYVYRFDRATGELTFTGHTGKVANPPILAIHPDGRHLYSVCEVGTFEGKKGGGVSAFRIDRRTGELTLLQPGALFRRSALLHQPGQTWPARAGRQLLREGASVCSPSARMALLLP